MPFKNGRVSFARFTVTGDAPAAITQETLDKLSQHAFTDSPVGAPEQVESGWISGEHIFDTSFTFDKNAFGNMLLFALRLDTNRIPADIKHAYQRAHEQAVAAGNPSGFLSRSQKKEVRELVDRQIHDELATGRHRRSKQVDLLWDLAAGHLYCAATGTVVQEQLAARFRETFDCDLEALTAGALAETLLQGKGRLRDFEDLHPSPFTAPPSVTRKDHEDATGPQDMSIPNVPWTHASPNSKDFLGNEFLLWLWWVTETREASVKVTLPTGDADVALVLLSSLEMECAWGVKGKQTLREAAPTQMGEAGEGLRNGKWPRKAGLILSDGENQWELSFNADRLLIGAAQLPEIADAASTRDLVEQRLGLTRQLAQTLDATFAAFLRERTVSGWDSTRQQMRDWIAKRRRR